MEAGNLALQYLPLFIFTDSNCYDQRCTERDLGCSRYLLCFCQGERFRGTRNFISFHLFNLHPALPVNGLRVGHNIWVKTILRHQNQTQKDHSLQGNHRWQKKQEQQGVPKILYWNVRTEETGILGQLLACGQGKPGQRIYGCHLNQKPAGRAPFYRS